MKTAKGKRRGRRGIGNYSLKGVEMDGTNAVQVYVWGTGKYRWGGLGHVAIQVLDTQAREIWLNRPVENQPQIESADYVYVFNGLLNSDQMVQTIRETMEEADGTPAADAAKVLAVGGAGELLGDAFADQTLWTPDDLRGLCGRLILTQAETEEEPVEEEEEPVVEEEKPPLALPKPSAAFVPPTYNGATGRHEPHATVS